MDGSVGGLDMGLDWVNVEREGSQLGMGKGGILFFMFLICFSFFSGSHFFK